MKTLPLLVPAAPPYTSRAHQEAACYNAPVESNSRPAHAKAPSGVPRKLYSTVSLYVCRAPCTEALTLVAEVDSSAASGKSAKVMKFMFGLQWSESQKGVVWVASYILTATPTGIEKAGL